MFFSINVKENIRPHNSFNPSVTCPGRNVLALFDAVVVEATEDQHKQLIECQVGEVGTYKLTGVCAGCNKCLNDLQ